MNLLELAEASVAAAGGDAEAIVLSEQSGLARFSGSEVNQPTLIENVVVALRVVRGGRVGTAQSNRLGPDGLRELARRADEAAASAVVDPDFPGLPEPAPLPDVTGWDASTAALGPDDQARLAGEAIGAAGETPVYGFFTSGESELAVASSTGVRAVQRMTDATAVVVAAGVGYSGYAEATAWAAGELDPATVAREAVEKAERTRGAAPAEPQHYRAVLEPYALADLLQYFSWSSFGALSLIEDRSYFSGRIGERAFGPKVTIVDDALDARGLPKSFDFEGVPKQRVALVEEGVVRGVVWDRETAARANSGAASTGHAPPASSRAWGPLPVSLRVEPGEAESTEELAELVGDGIYVTRLHYLGIVHAREGVITGMTRDGTFRIRDGKVAEPIVNLRFTVSMPELLGNVLGLTRELHLVNASDFYGERYPYGALVPSLATARFNVTGVGSDPGI